LELIVVFTWDADPVLLPGFLPLRAYGLCLALALVLGFLIWRRRMLRQGMSEAVAGAFLGWALLACVIGARLGHALFYEPSRFAADPLELLRLWRGGLASHGALAGLLLAAVLFSRHHGLSFARVADPLCLGGTLAAVLVRLGNFFNSEVVGRATGTGWGVRFLRHDHLLAPAQVPPRHPVQLYEAGLALAVLGLLLLVERRGAARPGLLSALFLFLLFAGRLLLERFKEPEGPTIGALTMGQVLSLPAALMGLLWLALLLRPQRESDRSKAPRV
jgi:prolipoprotein diacylglyceryl transferase